MKLSISTAFVTLVFSHTASIVSAIPTSSSVSPASNGNQQCNNSVSTKTVTVTASAAVTTAAAASTSSATNNVSTSGNNTSRGNNTTRDNNNNNGNNKNNNGNGNTTSSNNSTSSQSTTSTGSGNSTTGANPQTSLMLDPSVIGPNLAQNGLSGSPDAGEAASLTSVDNFINLCLGKTITNGLQNTGGSCNPVPMGDIPSRDNMISCKFSSPQNFDTVKANSEFTISMTIQGMQTGSFTNPNTNYFGAPQQLDGSGQVIGHSHFVIQQIANYTDTTVPDPSVFAFFQGVNAEAVSGVLTVTVTQGLNAGFYRLASINTASNHQCVSMPIAQHGSQDDAVYFEVSANGSNSTGVAGASPNTASTTSINSATSSASASTSETKPLAGNQNETASTKGTISQGGRRVRRFVTARIA